MAETNVGAAGALSTVEPVMRGDASGGKPPPGASRRPPAKGADVVRARRAPRLELRRKRVVLLLQGGGALGAYQVGAYEALAAALRDIGKDNVDWVGGISIGAVNSAVIAAPRCGDATDQLHALWKDLLFFPLPPWDWTAAWHWLRRPTDALARRAKPFTDARPWLKRVLPPFQYARLLGKWWNWTRIAFHPLGLGNFFSSRMAIPPLNPWFRQWARSVPPSLLAFYPTRRLRGTLEKHVDFDVINGANGKPKGPRISLGAARVTTGEVVFFENEPLEDERGNPVADAAGNHRFRTFRPDHVLASGALPPAFPPVRIDDPGFDDGARHADDRWYWDGGVSSNTPIEWLIGDLLPKDDGPDTIVFLIDVWDRKGPLPKTMDEVCWRQKSIEYGSLRDAAKRAVSAERSRRRERPEAPRPKLEICQLMYERDDDEGPQFAFADADFSRRTYEKMRAQGHADMAAALSGPYEVEPDELVPDGSVVLYRFGSRGKHLRTDRVRAPEPVE